VATQPVTLNLGGQFDVKELMPYCAQSITFDIILGIWRIRKWNPRINWKSNTLIDRDHEQKCNVCLSTQNSSKQLPNYVITIKQLKRDACKDRPVYLVPMHHVRTRGSTEGSASLEYATNEEIISPLGNSIASKHPSSSTLQSLLGQYSDVLPGDLPNELPSERSFEVKSTSWPMQTSEATDIQTINPELKEVKTKIDDLLERDLSVLSLAPGQLYSFRTKTGWWTTYVR
jgi:hypothetical protein